MAQIECESCILEQERGPHAWMLRCAFEECKSHFASEKRGSERLHGCGSHVLEQKCEPHILALRRAFKECGSHVASGKPGSEPRVLYLQDRLQLQNLQFVVVQTGVSCCFRETWVLASRFVFARQIATAESSIYC